MTSPRRMIASVNRLVSILFTGETYHNWGSNLYGRYESSCGCTEALTARGRGNGADGEHLDATRREGHSCANCKTVGRILLCRGVSCKFLAIRTGIAGKRLRLLRQDQCRLPCVARLSSPIFGASLGELLRYLQGCTTNVEEPLLVVVAR